MNCSRFTSRYFPSHRVSRCVARNYSSTVRSTNAALPPQRTTKLPSTISRRCLHATPTSYASRPPNSRDRPPRPTEDGQADFASLDMLRNTTTPATSIDACTSEGFALNNNMRISGCGVLLVGGEAFRWRPWVSEHRKEGTIEDGATGDDAMTGRLLNAKGQFDVPEETWGLLELVWLLVQDLSTSSEL